MSAEIEVLQPGLFSTIQDLGRTGYMKFGVPLSGAMDQYAAKTANLLLGNPANAAVLEITQMGPALKFNNACQISITGADLSPAVNKTAAKQNSVLQLAAGDVLSFGRRISGCRSYLAVKGGFQTEEVLGSRSWYEGVTTLPKLEKGIRLSFKPRMEERVENYASLKVKTAYLQEQTIKTFPGPEFEHLNPQQQKWLQETQLSIGRNNNRMAIQLEEELQNDLRPIITGPVVPGTIQLTPSGKMIVLMRDCQTTGGYPRILQVTSRGLNVLAQKVMGDSILFDI